MQFILYSLNLEGILETIRTFDPHHGGVEDEVTTVIKHWVHVELMGEREKETLNQHKVEMD